MWYLYPSSNKQLLQRFLEARIAAATMTIREPIVLEGIAYPEEDHQKVVELLRGQEEIEKTFRNTDQENVKLLAIKERYKIEVTTTDNIIHWTSLRETLKEFSVKYGRSIKVWVPHGKASAPQIERGRINIYFYSSPAPSERVEIPSTIYGIRIPDGVSDALHPSNVGILIRDEAGIPLAEITSGCIYFLFDLPHNEFDGRENLFRKILEEAFPFALKTSEELNGLNSPDSRSEEANQKFRSQIDTFREQYVLECTKRIGRRIEILNNSVSQKQIEVSQLETQLTEQSRRLEELRREVTSIEQKNKDLYDKFRLEFDKLCALPDVERIEVKEGDVTVYTGKIQFNKNYDNRQVSLSSGKFSFTIPTDGTDSIRFSPVSGNAKNHPHAYVRSGGKPCFGNITEAVQKCCAAYEYSIIAQLMIEYLKQS